jgi:hypothetical protein
MLTPYTPAGFDLTHYSTGLHTSEEIVSKTSNFLK